MSLNKAIEHNKEYRKPWYDVRAFDPWCRNHGLDKWYVNCVLQGAKRRSNFKAELKLREGLAEYYLYCKNSKVYYNE